MKLQKDYHVKYIIIGFFVLISSTQQLIAQTDKEDLYRRERLIEPGISTNGYGINLTIANKQKIDFYTYWQAGLSEIKHRKEIKGINPRYPNQNEFIYGKLQHLYPLSFRYGHIKKVVIKHKPNAIGIRFFYSAGIDIGILKPVYYNIELVYTQDSSKIITSQFDPEYHNVNNIRNRESWFKGINELNIAPGFSADIGFMVDFARVAGRIQGVGLSATAHAFILPAEILSQEPQRRLYFGFNLSYVWGKYQNTKFKTTKNSSHRGWDMLKKP